MSEKRFKVALSFPGEHRGRVEKIASLLGDRLGKEKILYDEWYAAEFAVPNLNIHLPKLYLDDSELLVFFLSKEHASKEWTGLEWRVGLDLIKRKQDHSLMLLRLDDSEIPGLLSIDGYLDIRKMTDADVAAAILSRCSNGGTSLPTRPRTFISKLPTVDPTLIGRQPQLDILDAAWSNRAANFLQIIAAGGTGKTALLDKWFRRHLNEATVFGWSFYSQGTSPDRQTSSDPFFAEILRWLRIEIAPGASIYAKAEAVANRLREERLLLLLDGVEPLQDTNGNLRDSALKALLQELDASNRGLVVCTTRLRMDVPDDAPRAQSIELDNLTAEQGAEYLGLKLQGPPEELRKASQEHGNHALALTLLATYLVDFHDGDIFARFEIPKLVEEGSHASRVIAAYERKFAQGPEAGILRALGYFDRPAEPAALKLVVPEMGDHQYRAALNRLHKARLILTNDPRQPVDCHPLLREHFAPQATKEGHARLYEHYKKQTEMTQLFYAVYHGCRAGRHQETLDDVYFGRILRGQEYYLTKKLGAFGTDLSLLVLLGHKRT